MKPRMRLRNVDKEFKILIAKRKDLTDAQAVVLVRNMVSDLEEKTPILTGFARSSWSFKKTMIGYRVTNTADYIQYLNHGSSKQAPAYFVESIALNYGKPLGMIVSVED